MGTNFYWRTGENGLLPTGDDLGDEYDADDPRRHIGKRSAAGKYCWDCDLTLCVQGKARIHYGNTDWYERCPRCGKEPEKVPSLSRGAAAIELGFAQPETARPTGVSSTSSFSWAQDPERVGAICEQHASEHIVKDEYGHELTGREFLDMLLANCGVQYTEFIGMAYS